MSIPTEQFQFLLGKRSRIALSVLAERTAPIELSELAAVVASREYDQPGEHVTRETAASLHHIHLPKLEEMGAVAYDQKRCQIHSHVDPAV